MKLTVTYTGFDKVGKVKQGTDSICYTYGYDHQRIYMEERMGTNVRTKRYWGNCEYVTEGNGSTSTSYWRTFVTGPYGVFAVVETRNGTDATHYVLKDNLGSWTTVTGWNGHVEQDVWFDAWGTPYLSGVTPLTPAASLMFDRGFTGHEHYDCIRVINANARLYDPIIGRFFSPDPFVQAPDFTQGFNRYSYCMNNPVMFSDPDGEFFIVDSWIVGFVSKFFETGSLKQSWNEANKRAGNDAKLWGGWFATDSNKGFWGQAGEILSRFTWQLPQTLIGWLVAESCNTLGFAGGVESVDYKYGATVSRTNNEDWGAVTLGSYITGSNSIRADENNFLFQHEYGHYLQSQATGIFYLPRYAIPSGLNCLGTKNHDYHPVEQDANIRAFKYFNKHIEGYNGWKRYRNPINGYEWSLPFSNEINQKVLMNGRLQPAWYDYFLFYNPILDGLINWLILEDY